MIVNKCKYNLYILGIILILMITLFPLAIAEDGTSESGDSSGESSESSSESNSEESSDESSSSEPSESSSESESSEINDGVEGNTNEENTLDDSDGAMDGISEENSEEDSDSEEQLDELNILEDYIEDDNAVYYELGEEELEQEVDETTEPSTSEPSTTEPSNSTPSTSTSSNSEPSNSEQEYYELDPKEIYEDINQTILKGNVVEVINNESNTSEFYIELDELTELDNNYNIEFSDIVQQNIFVDSPVYLNQRISLVNEQDYEIEITVNLWNHQELFLSGAESVEIFLKDELISEQPIFKLNLESLEEIELEIIYKYPPVKKEVSFVEETILDLLPRQARVINSDIPTNTIISKKINIKLYHEGPIHYFNINVPIDEIDKSKIKSIYFVEGDEYLSVDADIIMLPIIECNEGN